MKKILYAVLILSLLVAGCSSNNTTEIEKFIQDAFKARAEAVFMHKDKKPLERYFSAKAMEQTRRYLEWSPKGQWHNIKDLNYSTRLRFENVKVDGKLATATVYETVIVTWDFIDPSKVAGTDFVKEDAWGNRKHVLTMSLTPEGNWIIEEDVIEE